MKDNEKLNVAFGELIYEVAKKSGLVQNNDEQRLKSLLSEHPWAKDIKWEFSQSNDAEKTLKSSYDNMIDCCHKTGLSPNYKHMIDLMDNAAEIKEVETKTPYKQNDFLMRLSDVFKRDIDDMTQYKKITQEVDTLFIPTIEKTNSLPPFICNGNYCLTKKFPLQLEFSH